MECKANRIRTATIEARSSFWQSTCSAIRGGGDPDWDAVAAYREPLLALLAARYAWIDAAEREDVAHEILVELRQGLAARYEPDRGRFRAFLRGVVRNKVLARWKRARKLRPLPEDADPAHEPAAPTEDDGASVDLVAEALAAIRRWHDREARGGEEGLRRVYVLAGRLVRNESYKEIAAREGISSDTVKRILAGAREAIVADLLERTLPLGAPARAGLAWVRLARIVERALAAPGARGRCLDEVGRPEIREALESWVAALERARREVGGEREIQRGLDEVFGGAA